MSTRTIQDQEANGPVDFQQVQVQALPQTNSGILPVIWKKVSFELHSVATPLSEWHRPSDGGIEAYTPIFHASPESLGYRTLASLLISAIYKFHNTRISEMNDQILVTIQQNPDQNKTQDRITMSRSQMSCIRNRSPVVHFELASTYTTLGWTTNEQLPEMKSTGYHLRGL